MERYRFAEQAQAALEGLQQPIAIYQFINKRAVAIVLSDGFCKLLGYEDRAEAYHDMDTDMYKDTHPDDVARIADAAFRFATQGGKYEVVYRTRIRDGGGYRILHAIGEHVYTETGERLAHVAYTDEGIYLEDQQTGESSLKSTLTDVLHQESLLKENYYDYLTGLPSMTHFFELAEAGKAALKRRREEPVLLFFDISGMKYFNKMYGFAEGNKFLKKFAKLLSSTFTNENCCRIGGDHFAVYTQERGVEGVLERLFRECQTLNNGRSLPVRVGICAFEADNLHVSIACDGAKIACDSLRNTYSSGFRYYDEKLRDSTAMRQYIRLNFERALKERWIQAYYQPIVRAINSRICDEEALARWIDPEKGFLSPADFIPYLEDSGEIYKLDLYMLDRILEKICELQDAGLYVVPQSLNLSRADFDACDIVEEVRSRVDLAGVSHSLITIEITESTIGKNIDFMKREVKRFQELGFPVWMDDFGSGYSSIDVLQTIKFNLIKFDMSFVRRLDEGDEGRIILTEMMRMATALGVDTVTEGVETKEQARFLREIGCSKLQGYYFSKPVPSEEMMERYRKDSGKGFENPEESEYYEKIGRVNLYDLSVIESGEESTLHNIFNTLPMAIMEVKDDTVSLVRKNQAYRQFRKRFFSKKAFSGGSASPRDVKTDFMAMILECCKSGSRAFCDEQMADGSVIHFFVRRLAENPVTGRVAAAVAVLTITDPREGTTYENIARALTVDYYRLFYVDLETLDFIEYGSPVGREELSVMRQGKDFFNTAKQLMMPLLYEEDIPRVLRDLKKDAILSGLEEDGSFKMTFRVVKDGRPSNIDLKVMRMRNDRRHMILGVSPVDTPLEQLFSEGL